MNININETEIMDEEAAFAVEACGCRHASEAGGADRLFSPLSFVFKCTDEECGLEFEDADADTDCAFCPDCGSPAFVIKTPV